MKGWEQIVLKEHFFKQIITFQKPCTTNQELKEKFKNKPVKAKFYDCGYFHLAQICSISWNPWQVPLRQPTSLLQAKFPKIPRQTTLSDTIT